jgi:hypothetical protein
MKVLVCGSRNWLNYEAIHRELSRLPPGRETTIVHGGCPTGADNLADRIARKLGFEVRVYPADWDRDGRGAGPIRNAQMIRAEHPDKDGVIFDFGLAFTLNMSRSRGTKDCTERARKAGIKVEVFSL